MPETTQADPGPHRDGFRALMSGFPSGVGVVTSVDHRGQPTGMTCSSLSSVTLQPPTLLVCLRDRSRTLVAIRESGAFAVNLLTQEARSTAELFASGAPDRFGRVRWTMDADAAGPHLGHDAHAVADCRLTGTQLVGDHVVALGEVRRVVWHEEPRPLLYGLRRYAAWSAAVKEPATTPGGR
ncbi:MULTISPECIES: flavin reductase family protein [unclassified Streptomyces]|uniref:flavin reductase family protein n=1 Tax=unclassified Streptomyces TaxID=2593676 RepID=UPI000CD4EF28|nr:MULTISPECIES: flavin reductase family protein [unclassified Streptomyces]